MVSVRVEARFFKVKGRLGMNDFVRAHVDYHAAVERGDVVHSLRIEGVVSELYDVVVLPGVRRPTALGFKSDEIRRVISVGATPGA